MIRGKDIYLKVVRCRFEAELTTIRAFDTKTKREWQVAMGDRLRSDLLRLSRHQGKQPGLRNQLLAYFSSYTPWNQFTIHFLSAPETDLETGIRAEKCMLPIEKS
jgi:hypothetical protein